MALPVIKFNGPLNFAKFDFNGSIAVTKGDFMYYVTDDVRPITSLATASEAADQASIAPVFAGIANDTRFVTDTAAQTDFPVILDTVAEYDCVSSAWEVGDKVTVTYNGGAALVNQAVAKTTDATLAIGYCVRRSGTSTRVLVRFMSNVLQHVNEGGGAATLTSAALPVLTFNSGTTATNQIRLPDDQANALAVLIPSGNTFIKFITTNSAEGLVLGASGQTFGLYGTAGAARSSAYTQTYSTATRTHSNPTASSVATTGATNSTPYGYSQAQADAIVAAVNALVVDVANCKGMINSLVDDSQGIGLSS